MAHSGAHLTSLNALEHGLPSIFEVIAQESLIATLRPALKHVLKVLAQNNPERYGRVYGFADEIYSGLQLILENHFLKHYNASFSENFYGLKRVSADVSNRKSGESLNANVAVHSSDEKSTSVFPHISRSKHLRSLLFLVLVPYVKNKFDLLYERLTSSSHENIRSRDQSLKAKLCRAYLAFYPLVHVAWQGTMVAYRLAYVFRKTPHHSPFLRLAGVVLQNLTEDDIQMFSSRAGQSPNLGLLLKDRSWWKLLLTLVAKGVGFVSMALSSGLAVSVFFLQFLDWWYARDQDAASSLMALPTPDCPQQRVLASLPKHVALCPLCNRVRTNDTVLSVTGYVFCYPCIFKYVQEKQCCPLTGYPATTDHLVKLFLSDDV